MAHVARQAALSDTQDIADILLDAEVKLGEMLEKIPKKESYTGFQKRKAVVPKDITYKQSHYAQELAK